MSHVHTNTNEMKKTHVNMNWELRELRTGCSSKDGTATAPRNANDVSAISHKFLDILEYHFPWHGQYLVMLEGDSCCSGQCK